MPTTGRSTSASVPGSSISGVSGATRSEISSPSMQATLNPDSPSSAAIATVRSAAARGFAAPILVMITVPASRHGGSSARMRSSSCALYPRVGSSMRSRWPNASVRSPTHSMIMASSAPCLARSTAGPSRSAENPAPVPIRKVSPISVAVKAGDLGEEQILDRFRRLLDGADFRHEGCDLKHFLRLESECVIRVADDFDDVFDAVLPVARHLQIEFCRRPLVGIDDLDRRAQSLEECRVDFRIGLPELCAGGQENGGRRPAKNIVIG